MPESPLCRRPRAVNGPPRFLLPHGLGGTLALAALLLASGCGMRLGGGASGGDGSEPYPPAELMEEAGETQPESPSSPEGASPDTEVLLEQGQALLVAGRFEEAVSALETYLVFGDHPAHRRTAAWSLAMVYLLPSSPLRSQARAIPILQGIEEGHPGSMEALQAGWLRGLLQESARNRATVQTQEVSIRELNELVEQLKRIDLNRRPPGGGGG